MAHHITEKMIKGYGHAGSREAGHLLRRMADLQYQERDGEEHRNEMQRLV